MSRHASLFRVLAALLVVPPAAAACRGEDAPRAEANGSPDSTAWSLSAEPLAVAGAGGAPDGLDDVFSAFLRPDGSFVVGNSGGRQVMLFARDGRLLRATGRRGMGPGEFQGVSWVRPLPGDSVLAYDMMARRFSVLDASGGFSRSFSVSTPMGMARPLGVFSDGTLLIAEEGRFDPRRTSGAVRDRMVLFRAAGTGEVLRRLGEFDGAEWLSYGDGSSYRTTRLTFGRTGYAALSGDRVVYGSSDAARLGVYDGEGARMAEIRLPLAARRVSSGEKQAFVQSLLENVPPARQGGTRNALRSVALPDYAPLFTRLQPDHAGNLWVESPRPGGGSKWWVVRPDGSVIGSVWLPAGSHPLDVRDERMLVRTVGDSGEERVAVHRIRR